MLTVNCYAEVAAWRSCFQKAQNTSSKWAPCRFWMSFSWSYRLEISRFLPLQEKGYCSTKQITDVPAHKTLSCKMFTWLTRIALAMLHCHSRPKTMPVFTLESHGPSFFPPPLPLIFFSLVGLRYEKLLPSRWAFWNSADKITDDHGSWVQGATALSTYTQGC